MKERGKRILKDFVVLGDIVLLIFLLILVINEIYRFIKYDEFFTEEIVITLLIIALTIVNIVALCDTPRIKESWLSLALKKRRLEQHAKIKDLEQRLKEDKR